MKRKRASLNSKSKTPKCFFKIIFPVLVLIWAACHSVQAQQPFFTDDADVTEKGKFLLEITNQFDRLQTSSLPVIYGNTARATLSFGAAENVEISVSGQYLTLINDSSEDRRIVGGIGDTTFAAKYNFYREKKDSRLPALTLSGFVNFPTGDASRELNTGIRNYGFNAIAQKTVRENNVFRVNAGCIFSGDPDARGNIFTGGASYVRTIGDKLQLGGEITGASAKGILSEIKQLQTQFGGNYRFRRNMTLDFGIIAGRFAASPRVGGQIGISIDF